jgi:phosphoglycolate phosphatase
MQSGNTPMVNQKYNCELLIFDLDGTLVDTVEDIAQAVNFSLRSLGFGEQSLASLAGYVGDGVRKLLQRAFSSEDPQLIDKAVENFRYYYRNHICDYSYVYAGIEYMLDHYHQKKLTILTNKTQEFADDLLKRTGLFSRFTMVVGGGAGYAYKPDPEAVTAILHAVDGDASQAMIIGDSPNDITAGKNAGIKTCAVSYGYSTRAMLQKCEPEIIIDHPAELMDYVLK